MHPALSALIPNGLLAAMPQLREKPHQGLPTSNPAVYLGFNVCKSTTVLGLRAAEHLERVRSRSTGKERDTESGNDYFGARYYASSMGRFMSPDWSAKVTPVPYAKLDNPQSLNLYAYVNDNPISGVDPDGHAGCKDTPQLCAAIRDAVAQGKSIVDGAISFLQGKQATLALKSPQAPGVTGDAKKALLSGLDSMKVGKNTVGGLAKTLHNESNGLSGGAPGALVKGKTAEANAIFNNAELPKPHMMAPSTGSASPQDKEIMEQTFYNRATGGDDPVEGRTFFGNSAQDLSSRPIGNSRQTVYDQYGPFTWGSNAPQYIYIYNDPEKK